LVRALLHEVLLSEAWSIVVQPLARCLLHGVRLECRPM